jgi:hypothetical protein
MKVVGPLTICFLRSEKLNIVSFLKQGKRFAIFINREEQQSSRIINGIPTKTYTSALDDHHGTRPP